MIGPACDVIQEGSGFVAADGYVVTNAHVVAGMDDPRCVRRSAASTDATTVLFDPDLDLAILSVPNAPGPPLPLVHRAAGPRRARGRPRVPAGWPASTSAAPPSGGRSDAVGRDIYGHGEVERLVLELQTLVRPGNSGGPFRAAATVGSPGSCSRRRPATTTSATRSRPARSDDPLQIAMGRTRRSTRGPASADPATTASARPTYASAYSSITTRTSPSRDRRENGRDLALAAEHHAHRAPRRPEGCAPRRCSATSAGAGRLIVSRFSWARADSPSIACSIR